MPRKEKQPVHHVQMTEGKINLIRALLQEYEIESAQMALQALRMPLMRLSPKRNTKDA